MDPVEQVRRLIEIMNENDLAELDVEEPELRVRMKKNVPVQYVAPPPGFGQYPPQPGYQHALQPGQAAEAADGGAPGRDENLVEVTSPMVGTFYRSSSPGAEPYVTIGSGVDADTVVCIIEAMKVMNEIKAEVEGTIVEILVEDAEPIEFGQVLFLVEPGVKAGD